MRLLLFQFVYYIYIILLYVNSQYILGLQVVVVIYKREMSQMRSLFCINVMLAPGWCWQSQSHLRSLEVQKHPLLGYTNIHQHQSFLDILNINILHIGQWEVQVIDSNISYELHLPSEQHDWGPSRGWYPTWRSAWWKVRARSSTITLRRWVGCCSWMYIYLQEIHHKILMNIHPWWC